jgi:hypothetical protein
MNDELIILNNQPFLDIYNSSFIIHNFDVIFNYLGKL